MGVAVACGIFWHANRRGYRRATWWGVGGFLLGPFMLPIYALRVWADRRRR